MSRITAEAKTVRQLLAGQKYAIEDFQREYKWLEKQVGELIEDLSDVLDGYDSADPRSEVERYSHYFLGSIIISHKNGRSYVIDGQQRLTTLTLMLMYLNQLQRQREGEPVQLDELIFAQKFGKRSFNLDIAERVPAMEALFTGQPFDDAGASESVRNILGRYRYINDHFPGELAGDALYHFIDWLIENVQLVEITAESDEDAYTIFETMNDRGLSLSNPEMLKGYLLSKIMDECTKASAAATWRNRIRPLVELGKEEDADFFKAWLRSQYAQTIRERKKGAEKRDWDLLGTEFHRWVREYEEKIGLRTSGDFARFIELDLSFYARWYYALRLASVNLTPGLEPVFYNAQLGFTLQFPLLLAPLKPDDPDDTIATKLRLVATYVDILLAWRLWNFRTITYSTMQYAMFVVMREIRGKEPGELADILRSQLATEPQTFASNDRLRVHQQNQRAIHTMLARITDHVERQSGLPSHYLEYIGGSGRNRYEVEHIWANKPERHRDEFPHPADFAEYRNRIGGLLLLPRQFNEAFGDLEYTKKLDHYYGQNVLARSLHPNCYTREPGFLSYKRRSQLPFTAHEQFKTADLDARYELYRRIAEEIWSPELLQPDIYS